MSKMASKTFVHSAVQMRSLAAHDLGHLVEWELLVARIDALRGKGHREVDPHLQARFLEQGDEEVVCGARIGRAAENHQLSAPETLPDLLHRLHDVGDIGILGLGEGSRHADVDHIGLGQRSVVEGGLELARVQCRLHLLRGDVLEVGSALVDGPDLFLVQLEAGDPEPRLGKLERQGQPHVAETDDTDLRMAGIDPFAQLLEPSHTMFSSGGGVSAPAEETGAEIVGKVDVTRPQGECGRRTQECQADAMGRQTEGRIRKEQSPDCHVLRQGLHLAWPGRGHYLAPGRCDSTQARHRQLAPDDHHHQGSGPPGNPFDVEENDERGRHGELVGQGIQELADPGDLLAPAGGHTVEDVTQCGDDEEPGDDPASHRPVEEGECKQDGNDGEPHHRDGVGKIPETLADQRRRRRL